MHVVVGLRNPGPGYEGTRHNIGYEVVLCLLARSDSTLGRAPSRLRSSVATMGTADDRALFVVPNTFVNESGSAVRACLDYYKAEPGSMIVAHDDIDLPFGRLRLQVGGGSGGHNGVASIERSLGTAEFSRLKLGVGRPPGSLDPAEFVLRRFAGSERGEVDLMIEDAADVVTMWMREPARAQQAAAMRGRDG